MPSQRRNGRDNNSLVYNLLKGVTMQRKANISDSENPMGQKRMPVLFIGHGSPMNAIEDNVFSRTWQELGRTLPKPKAILCISAHWETEGGSFVTAMEQPRTIHDFGGFPEELYQAQYPAPGSTWLAREIKKAVTAVPVDVDNEWGLDHGTWSVLSRMYPAADIPVVQLSLNRTGHSRDHYAIGREFLGLRERGVLIIGSGNMVHNLGRIELRGPDFNEPFGFDWAIEANDLFKKLIIESRHEELVNFRDLGKAARLAIPTSEHFLPLLYILALKRDGEKVTFFNDAPVAGSLTMTSLVID
jgi:4,5-DOPA dioxygenase extradiol